jgi:hypothetical protein
MELGDRLTGAGARDHKYVRVHELVYKCKVRGCHCDLNTK